MPVAYDLARQRPTYDFCVWLERAWQEGHREVAIRPGPNHGFQPEPHPPADPAERRYMLENVMLPAVPRFGMTLVQEGEPLGGADFRHVVSNYRAGLGLTHPEPSGKARRLVASWVARPYVTVTLRQSRKFPARNSNLPAWRAFAESLQPRIAVHVIPDTDHAHEGCGWAAVSLDLRMALYEGAEMNFGINNGPTSLLCLMRAPYCLFKQVTRSIAATTERHWREKVGVAAGEQFPWAGERQRLMWRDDTPEALQEAARAFL